MELSKTIQSLQNRLNESRNASNTSSQSVHVGTDGQVASILQQHELQRQGWAQREAHLESMVQALQQQQQQQQLVLPTTVPASAVGTSSMYASPAAVDVSVDVLQQSLSDAHRLSERHLQENQGLINMVQQLQAENSQLRMASQGGR